MRRLLAVAVVGFFGCAGLRNATTSEPMRPEAMVDTRRPGSGPGSRASSRRSDAVRAVSMMATNYLTIQGAEKPLGGDGEETATRLRQALEELQQAGGDEAAVDLLQRVDLGGAGLQTP